MKFVKVISCIVALILTIGCPAEYEVVTPTTSANRMAAEWEPVIGSIIAWPLIIPKSLVIELAKEKMLLYVMVSDEVNRYEAENTFKEWGVNMDNVHFVVTRLGLAWGWPRDWGPFAVYSDSGAYFLADPQFVTYPLAGLNCDGTLRSDEHPNQDFFSKERYIGDDLASSALADSLGFDISQLAAAVTGGNFLVDGNGTAFSTCTIQMENRSLGLSDEEFFKLLEEKLGIKTHVILPNFERFGIQHIDCAIKLLDEETILVVRVPEDHPEYKFIEEIAQKLQSLTNNTYGRPYKIVRIDTGYYESKRVAAYTNSLIFNKKVFVPLFGIPEDKQALKTWQDAMPGYEVIGFENDIPVPVMGYTGWQSFDGLHCRVRAIWDPAMLRMAHRRMDNVVEPAKSWPIEVKIQDYSKAGLITEELKLYVRTQSDQAWQVIILSSTQNPNIFQASIPGVNSGTTVEYYVSAADNSGRRETLPRTAPDNFYSFTVE
jgi:agmatine deiminase